ncbi:MAG: hypothetical protein Q8R29_00355 [bacterium]|nr:hypothetical protein [bacterium]
MPDIVILKRTGGFHVKEKDKEAWGFGSSLNDALGEMLRANSKHFGFQFTWDRNDPETLKFLTSKKKRPRRESRKVHLKSTTS